LVGHGGTLLDLLALHFDVDVVMRKLISKPPEIRVPPIALSIVSQAN